MAEVPARYGLPRENFQHFSPTPRLFRDDSAAIKLVLGVIFDSLCGHRWPCRPRVIKRVIGRLNRLAQPL